MTNNAHPVEISLSLVSHTNAGKTTLARTLLSQDVGTIRDEPHVTEVAQMHVLFESAKADRLILWDTPGFGDSARLARRLSNTDNPVGWFIGQVWDRINDRPMHSSQQALVNVKAQADVVLYLVNASEDPLDAGYVEPEMRILTWTGKPVIVLLNQMGPPRDGALEQADLRRWRDHLSDQEPVRAVLALDAFARCWVQEGALLNQITALLATEKRAAYDGIKSQWFAARRTRFDQAIQLLSTGLATLAIDQETVPDRGVSGRLRELGASIGLGRSAEKQARDTAMLELAKRWDDSGRTITDGLIALHELSGESASEVITRVEAHFSIDKELDEGAAALLGGVATGAAAGLKADLATGGMTLGGGMIAGGVIGALGAAGLARGYNLVRGLHGTAISWSDAVLLSKVQNSVLTYLAVAHFGRGRGDWERAEYPSHWLILVKNTVELHRTQFVEAWKQRHGDRSQQQLATLITPALHTATVAVLLELYPESASALVNNP